MDGSDGADGADGHEGTTTNARAGKGLTRPLVRAVVAWPLVPIAVGQTFERYEIESLIGRGGMGEVYRAVDTRLRRKVALKVLRPDRENAEAVARLFREARSAAVLTHPNTVAIHDIGESDGIFYIVMELVTGMSLLAYVGDARVSAARKLAWLVDVARALAAAHRAGVVHRDVKPSNVMVSDEGAVKVLDFGLAKPLAPVSFRTQQGHVLGTPRYMAPEQLAGQEVDARSDQYAFALTAYELVAGRHPGGALAGSIVPPRLDQVMPEVSRAVADVIARAMSNKPGHRFASMEDVAVALEDAIAGRPVRGLTAATATANVEREHERDVSEVTAIEALATSAPATAAATTKRAGGAGAPVTAALDVLPPATPAAPAQGAPSPAVAPPVVPTAGESESDVPTATARTVATAVELAAPVQTAAAFDKTVPHAPALAAVIAAAPPVRTLMSREAPAPPAAKTLLTAGVAPPEEVVRVVDVRAEAAAKAKANANASAKADANASARADADADADAGAKAGAEGERAAAGSAEVRPAGVPAASRWPLVVVAVVVIGGCAFVGAYFGSKALARRPEAPSSAPAATSASGAASAGVAP